MSELKRQLNSKATLALIVGGIIGSGIFMKPTYMANQLDSPLLILSVWIVAGFITLIGALCNAEVAAMIPETGGQLVFFEKMFGKKFAFSYGWASIVVFNTAGNASIAYIGATFTGFIIQLPNLPNEMVEKYHVLIPYVGHIYFLKDFGLKILTSGYLLLFTILNVYSTSLGASVQKILSIIKVLGFGLLICGLLFSGKGNWTNLYTQTAHIPFNLNTFGSYMACVSAVFWAFDGWNNITFVAGEIENPQKNIPKNLFLGMLTCIVIYFLVNVSYLYILPLGTIAKTPLAASTAFGIVWGPQAATFITILIIFSTLGAANACILSTSRVTYSFGTGYKILPIAGKEHPKYKTPANALWINLIWAVILVFSGSFDILTDMLVFVSWFYYGASGVGLFVLRYKWKKVERPYKVIGYPILPIIFIGFVLCFLITTVYTDFKHFFEGKIPVVNSFLGVLLTLIGFPLYYISNYFNRNKKSLR